MFDNAQYVFRMEHSTEFTALDLNARTMIEIVNMNTGPEYMSEYLLRPVKSL